jgi:predicted TIM-barrel fold metal-dependent hydrolase
MTQAVRDSNDLSSHYTIISADCHAGGSHQQYREYLDPQYLDDFDAWRGRYKNPFRDLQDGGRIRNWDDDRRNSDLEGQGLVAEVVFPNTVPPFFPSFVLFAGPPKPDEYEHRLAGIRAHNRWLVDFCNRFPERRAGIGQIFINDIDDAIEQVKWIKDHGLRGGVLLPNVAPDVKWVKPLYDPEYDRLWAVCQDLDVPINVHGGTGAPDYGKYAVANLLFINEVSFYSQRPLVQFILSGVFERFPKLKFVITETGGAWVPGLMKNLDRTLDRIRKTGRTGELAYSDEHKLNKLASEYFAQNCYVGVSQPGPLDAAARYDIGLDRFMWGSDYPHDEGTMPYTSEHLRQIFSGAPEAEMRKILAGNAAAVYGFDLDKLAPLASKVGPTVGEIATPLDVLPDPPNEALLKGVNV